MGEIYRPLLQCIVTLILFTYSLSFAIKWWLDLMSAAKHSQVPLRPFHLDGDDGCAHSLVPHARQPRPHTRLDPHHLLGEVLHTQLLQHALRILERKREDKGEERNDEKKISGKIVALYRKFALSSQHSVEKKIPYTCSESPL